MPQCTYKNWFRASLAVALLGAVSVHAAQYKPMICVSPEYGDPRLLEVEYLADAPVPCRTHYRKWSGREQIGAAENTPGYCESLADQVVEKLAADGFLCRRVDADEDLESVFIQHLHGKQN